MSKVLGSQISVARFDPLQEREAGHFLLDLLNDPDNLVEHIRKYDGSHSIEINKSIEKD